MGLNLNGASNFFIKIRHNLTGDGNDGSTDLLAATPTSASEDIGWTSQAKATTDTGTFSLIQLFKRFLADKLFIGANNTASSLSVCQPTDDVLRTDSANISTKSNAIATSTASCDTKLTTTNATLALLPPKPLVAVTYTWTRPNDVVAYTIGDVVSDSTTTSTVPFWDNLVAVAGDTGYIEKITITCSHNTLYQLRLFLFKASPTTAADNVQATIADADMTLANFQGYFDPGTLVATNIAAAAAGNAAITFVPASPVPFTTGATKGLFGQVVTLAATTPVAQAIFAITLYVRRV